MILSLLVKGKMKKLAIALLWGLAILTGYLGEEEKNLSYFYFFVVAGNALFYHAVATRLALLTQNDMSKVIPHYFYRLKTSLLTLLGISFLPTLWLLPDTKAWMSIIAISIILAVFMVAITYRSYIAWASFILLLVEPWNWVTRYFELPHIDISLLWSPYALPVIALGACWLLGRLEHFTKDSKDLEKAKVIMNAKQSSMFMPSHKIPLKFQNKLVQWFAKSNLRRFKHRLKSAKPMTNRQRIAVACQGEYSAGAMTYLLWLGAAVSFLLIGSYLDTNFNEFFSTLIIAVPMVIFGVSSISFFQIVASKQSLLKRLALMPCFNEEQRFSTAFLHYVLEEQLKLYVFMSLILTMFSCAFEYFTWTLLFNSLLLSLIASLFNAAIMLWAWTMQKTIDGLAVWLMLAYLIGAAVFLIIVVNFNMSLWESSTFIGFLLVILSLCCFNVFTSYRKNSHCI